MNIAHRNVLLITSDQHRADCIGAIGGQAVTPHLDSLVKAGTTFTTAITPNCVCQPSRASILTGLLPLTHGSRDNGVDLPFATGERGFAGSFATAGYATGIIGKAHFSTYNTYEPTGRPECLLSNADYPSSWMGPYMGFASVQLIAKPHRVGRPARPPNGLHYEDWYFNGKEDDLREAWMFDVPPDKLTGGANWHSSIPSAWHPSTWCADQAIGFIRANRESPFCLWASFGDPHPPYDPPRPWSYIRAPEDVALPEHRRRDLDRRPWWHKASLERVPDVPDDRLRAVRERVSRVPELTDRQLAEAIAAYYGMIALLDHNVGRILLALDDLGLLDSTLVVYSSDHGDWMGDHGLIQKGPMMYDGLLRIPLIVSGPGVKTGHSTNVPVSSLDLAATFYDFAGLHDPGGHGRSLLRLLRGQDDRDHAYNEWDVSASRCGVELRLRTIRTVSYRLTLEENSNDGELYDLDEDPAEMDNRFDDPAYRAVRDDLIALIRARPRDAIDPSIPPVGIA